MEDQVTINISDPIPAPNAATIDKDGLIGNAVSKTQFSQDLNEFKSEIQSMIDSDFKGVIMPTDATPSEDGSYKPGISSMDANSSNPSDYGTLYPNAGNLRAKKGFSTVFYKKGTVWTKSEEELPQAQKTIQDFSELSFPATKASGPFVYNDAIWEVKTGQTASITDLPSLDSTSKYKSLGLSVAEFQKMAKPSTNIFNKSIAAAGQLILNTGSLSVTNNWIYLKIKVEPSTTYTISGLTAIASNLARIFMYPASTGSANTSLTVMSTGDTSNVTFTTGSDTNYIGVNIATGTNIGLNPTDNVAVNKLQIEKGTSASPYSIYGGYTLPYVDNQVSALATTINSSITGLQNNINTASNNIIAVDNKVNEIRVPVPNLFNKSEAKGGQLILSAGNISATNNWIYFKMQVQPSTTYTISGVTAIPSNLARIFMYPASTGSADTALTIMSDNTTNNITFTTGSATNYIGINLGTGTGIGLTSSDNVIVNKLQIEKGSEATSYKPYGGYSIPYVDAQIATINQKLENLDVRTFINNPKGPFPPKINDVQIIDSTYEPLDVDKFGTAYFIKNRSIYYTKNSGATFTLVWNFPNHVIQGVRLLGDGELLFIAGKTLSESVSVWKSTGWNNGNPTGSITVNKVYNTPNNLSDINNFWGTHVYENEVLLSEYGNRGEAWYVYYSNNYGVNFTQIFDLSQHADNPSEAHVHGSCIDPYRGWLWIVTGDVTNSATYYSTNKGATWVVLEDIHNCNVLPHQHVTVFPFADCVLFMSDRRNITPDMPNGIYRIDIPIDNPNSITYRNIKLAYKVDNSQFLVEMGSNAFKNYYNKNQPTYFCFKRTSSGAGENIPTAIYASFDGRNIFKQYESPVLPLSSGFRLIVGPDVNGYLFSNYVDEAGTFKNLKLKASDWA